MMVNLSDKSKRIIEAKLNGKKNKDIGKLEFPDATEGSQAVLVSRELKKPHVAQYYDKELNVLLAEHGVTKSQYIMNIGLGMQAMKQNQFTGEITDDLGMRLQANKQAERFLKFDEETPQSKENLEGLDDYELTHAILRKK